MSAPLVPQRYNIPSEVQAIVRQRASSLCEYCHAAETWQYVEFTMEHLVPIASGGDNSVDNLALACFACNRHKWHHQSAVDPQTGEAQRFFNPRLDSWNEHFAWSPDGLEIVGLTAVGRATADALQLNRERAKLIRAADIEAGRHPPDGDRRLT